MSSIPQVLLEILKALLLELPELAAIIQRGLAHADADDPLVPQLKAIMPEHSASAAAAAKLRAQGY